MIFKKKNKKNELVRWGIAAGFLECVYVFLVILVSNLLVDSSQKLNDPFKGSLFMLLFFVVSVLISGVLVLGRPFMLFLNKKIIQAISVFFITLVTIFIIFVIVGVVIFV